MDVVWILVTAIQMQSNYAVVFVRGELPDLPLAIERAGRAAMKPITFSCSCLENKRLQNTSIHQAPNHTLDGLAIISKLISNLYLHRA